MAGPGRFLRGMAHALDLRQREAVDVALRRAADESCAAAAHELGFAQFRFGFEGVVCGALPLAEFEGWIWAGRLIVRGIEWLDLDRPEPAAVAAFLDHAAGLAEAPPLSVSGGLCWGALADRPEVDGSGYPFVEELEVMRQVFRTASRGEPLPAGDVHAVAASLEAYGTSGEEPSLPLIHGARTAYQPAHALNTAILSLALVESLGMGAEERRDSITAALLHDIGMARLPAETVEGDHFSSQDRARVRGHPLEGARLLLRQSTPWESAAVASYEHHLRQDGSGYPRLSYPREPHVLSRVVAVCDAFDARLAPRPDRAAFDPVSAMLELERSMAAQFDSRVVSAFSDVVMRHAGSGGLALTSRLT